MFFFICAQLIYICIFINAYSFNIWHTYKIMKIFNDLLTESESNVGPKDVKATERRYQKIGSIEKNSARYWKMAAKWLNQLNTKFELNQAVPA